VDPSKGEGIKKVKKKKKKNGSGLITEIISLEEGGRRT
jgi:hypothetical protein